MLKKSGSDLIAVWERLVNEDVQLEGLGVDITNINATFVGEEDAVTLALGCYADIIFCSRWVGEEGLDNEVGECASHGRDLMDRSLLVQIFGRSGYQVGECHVRIRVKSQTRNGPAPHPGAPYLRET